MHIFFPDIKIREEATHRKEFPKQQEEESEEEGNPGLIASSVNLRLRTNFCFVWSLELLVKTMSITSVQPLEAEDMEEPAQN